MVLGNAHYFAQASFLNKGYLIPFAKIASDIESSPNPSVWIDATNSDPKPLFASLSKTTEVVRVRNPPLAASEDTAVIWYLRPARWDDNRVDELLENDFAKDEKRYLPYEDWERWLLSRLTGEEAPTHYYVATRWTRR